MTRYPSRLRILPVLAGLALLTPALITPAGAAPALPPPVILPTPLPPPSVLAPYRFASPADPPASPLEQQKALAYRQQLQQSLNGLNPGFPPDRKRSDNARPLDAERNRIGGLTGQ